VDAFSLGTYLYFSPAASQTGGGDLDTADHGLLPGGLHDADGLFGRSGQKGAEMAGGGGGRGGEDGLRVMAAIGEVGRVGVVGVRAAGGGELRRRRRRGEMGVVLRGAVHGLVVPGGVCILRRERAVGGVVVVVVVEGKVEMEVVMMATLRELKRGGQIGPGETAGWRQAGAGIVWGSRMLLLLPPLLLVVVLLLLRRRRRCVEHRVNEGRGAMPIRRPVGPSRVENAKTANTCARGSVAAAARSNAKAIAIGLHVHGHECLAGC
jgi:hypothetical protein